VLRDGSEEERQSARTELGLILERLGLVAEAAEAYRANVAAGVRDRRPYERLAALAQADGDAAQEAAMLRALADLLDPPASPSAERVVMETASAPTPIDAAAIEPDSASSNAPARAWRWPPGWTGGGRVAAGRGLRRRTEIGSLIQARPGVVSRVGRGQVVASGLLALVMIALVIWRVSAILGTSSAIDPTPDVAAVATSPVLPVVADAPSPAPVDLRLVAEARTLASPTALPLSPVALATPVPSPTLLPLPERCANASLRFPETRDTEAAVQAAFREYLARQGVTIDSASTLFAGLGQAYAVRHAEVVAGWMAVTLQRERRGLSTFSLSDYVASDVVVATGPGEYQLRATVSPQGWSDITSWPASSCEGAFVRNPDNGRWVQLMQATVGDITWALPAQTPR
jgi:hypothetical protein